MIEQLMIACNNFFPHKAMCGTWDTDNLIQAAQIPAQAYFKIWGSLYNDGIYQNTEALQLTAETFDGVITILAPPKAFCELAEKIADYNSKHTPNGYTSESFGGYSYNKATADADSWQAVYAKELKRWRKI